MQDLSLDMVIANKHKCMRDFILIYMETRHFFNEENDEAST